MCLPAWIRLGMAAPEPARSWRCEHRCELMDSNDHHRTGFDLTVAARLRHWLSKAHKLVDRLATALKDSALERGYTNLVISEP